MIELTRTHAGTRLALTAALAIGLLAGCASETTDDGGAPSSTPPPVVSSPASTSAPDPTTSAPAAETSDEAGGNDEKSWTMPDQTGQDLQDSQNAIQKLTNYSIFVTKSNDASGQGRLQILDHDWKVCSQNIAPGRKITADSKIVFNVVKQDESCP